MLARGRESGRDPRSRFAGHFGEVSRRYCVRPRRVTSNQPVVAADMVGIVALNAIWRGNDRCPERLRAVTHAASGQDDLLDIGEDGWRRWRSRLDIVAAGRRRGPRLIEAMI